MSHSISLLICKDVDGDSFAPAASCMCMREETRLRVSANE